MIFSKSYSKFVVSLQLLFNTNNDSMTYIYSSFVLYILIFFYGVYLNYWPKWFDYEQNPL